MLWEKSKQLKTERQDAKLSNKTETTPARLVNFQGQIYYTWPRHPLWITTYFGKDNSLWIEWPPLPSLDYGLYVHKSIHYYASVVCFFKEDPVNFCPLDPYTHSGKFAGPQIQSWSWQRIPIKQLRWTWNYVKCLRMRLLFIFKTPPVESFIPILQVGKLRLWEKIFSR